MQNAEKRAAVEIREELSRDIGGIREVVNGAFGRRGEADLVDRLRADGDCVMSLIAEDGHEIVGHVLFSGMTAPFRALGLGPVAVRTTRQRQGIGSRLIRDGLERAQRSGWEGVFVLGDPSYYRRFGFGPGLAKGFTSPYSGPYLMALALAGPLPMLTGRIEYAPAFAGLE